GGVTVTLTGSDDTGASVSMTTTTAADGTYDFVNLRPGTYVITETPPAGFFQGMEVLGSVTGGFGGDAGSLGTNSYTLITLTAGAVAQNYDFPELQPSTLDGSVYLDVNGNRTRDSGEEGLPGVTVTLTGTDATGASVSQSVVTDANGDFSFA